MNWIRLSVALLLSVGALQVCHAGLREEFPEFFTTRPAAPPGQKNAWDLLLALPGIAAGDLAIMDTWRVGEPDWIRNIDQSQVRKVAATNRRVLDAMQEMLDCPVLQPGANLFEPTESGASRRFIRASVLYLTDAAIRGRAGDKEFSQNQCWKVAAFCRRYCEARPILIDTLMTVTIMRFSVRTALQAGVTDALRPEELRKSADICARYDDMGRITQRALLGEASWMLQSHEGLITGGAARHDIILQKAVDLELSKQWQASSTPADVVKPEADTKASLRERWKAEPPVALKEALAAAELTDWLRFLRHEAGGFRSILNADMSSVTRFNKTLHPPGEPVSLKGGPLEAYFPASTDMPEFCMQTAGGAVAEMRLARVAFQLLALERERHELPATLESLVPEFMMSIPFDPFDGKPVRYDHKNRLIWCVGMNLRDEHGGYEPGKKDGMDDPSIALPTGK